MNIHSPFEEELKTCKASMKKLRKKIYKYSTIHKTQTKPRDSINGIMSRLKDRNLPNFLLDSLKKRRNFQLVSIKNAYVCEGVPLMEITNLRTDQEKQIEKLFNQHKDRMKQINDKKALSSLNLDNLKEIKNSIKLSKRQTNYSSTEEKQSLYHESSDLQEQNYLYFESEAQSAIHYASYHESIQHEDFDLNDFRQQEGFGNLKDDRECYQEDVWMKFDAGVDCMINYD